MIFRQYGENSPQTYGKYKTFKVFGSFDLLEKIVKLSCCKGGKKTQEVNSVFESA